MEEGENNQQKNKFEETNKILERSFKEAHMYSNKNMTLEKQIRVYIVPLLALAVFFAVIFAGTIPSIKQLFTKKDELVVLNATLDQKKAELVELQQLRQSNDLNSELLERLDLIIPTAKTGVVDYRKKVQEIAFDNFVEMNDVKIGERILVKNDSESSQQAQGQTVALTELELVQIPTQFDLSGELQNFRKMLFSIYSATDFIIISEMSLTNDQDGKSVAELTLAKYQYLPVGNAEQERRLLDSVSYKEKIDEQVTEFIRRKTDIEKNENNETDSDEVN